MKAGSKLRANYSRDECWRRLAFTLIELLVSIAIIGILAGLLLSGLSQAKRKVQTVVCLSNLKQIGLATSIYMSEYNKLLADLPGPHYWMLPLQRYAQISEKVRTCPSTRTFPSARVRQDPSENGKVNHTWLVIDNDRSVSYQGSYARNWWISAMSQPGDFFYTTEGSISEPARTPFFVDSVCVVTQPEEVDLPAQNLMTGDEGVGTTLGAGLSVVAIPRHAAALSAAVTKFDVSKKLPGAVNAVFGDSHAETVRLERLWTFPWHRKWREQGARWSLAPGISPGN